MQVNEAGVKLGITYEKLCLVAYPDPATGGDPWTNGVGHTSLAGPPAVFKGQKWSREKALQVYRADLNHFGMGVLRYVKVALNENQFSALVLFAMNVGLGNFIRSNVLRAVNARDFASVPRKLAMWVRAAGRVLRGLVKRRHAEGLLFTALVGAAHLLQEELPLPTNDEIEEMHDASGLIDMPMGKPVFQSSISWSAISMGVAAVGEFVSGAFHEAQNAFWQIMPFQDLIPDRMWLPLLFLVITLALVGFIIHERQKKSMDDGV